MPASTSSAFEAGAGTSPDSTYLFVASIGCAIAVLWLIWLAISAYRGWVKGRVDADVLGWGLLRGVMVIVILFWLFLP